MANVTEIVDQVGRTITNDDNADTFIGTKSTMSTTHGGRYLEITGETTFATTDIPSDDNDSLVINSRVLYFSDNTSSLANAGSTDNATFHIFNSSIVIPKEITSSNTFIGDGGAAGTTTSNVHGMYFHNCDFIIGSQQQVTLNFGGVTDCRVRYSDPGSDLNNGSNRRNYNFRNNAFIRGWDTNGGPRADNSFGGFRFVATVLNGAPSEFTGYSTIKEGPVVAIDDGAIIFSPEFFVSEAIEHPVNTTFAGTPTICRIISGPGIIWTSPRFDPTESGWIVGTDDVDREFARNMAAARWRARYFHTPTDTTEGVFARISTNASYSNPGIGVTDDRGIRGISQSSRSFVYVTESDGYFYGGTALDGSVENDSTNSTRFDDIRIPIRVGEYNNTADSVNFGNNTSFVIGAQQNTTDFETTIDVISLYGSVSGQRVWNTTNDRFADDADYEVGQLAYSALNEPAITDVRDEGFDQYIGDDVDATIANIEDIFDDEDNIVTNNSIPALYKIALVRGEIDVDDYLIVGNGTWDISDNTMNELKLGAYSSGEYEVSDSDFSIRGAGITAADDDTITGYKISRFDQQGTIDGLDIEVTNTGQTGWVTDQVYRTNIESEFVTFANCTLKGALSAGRTGIAGSLTFGDNVDVSELSIRNISTESLSIFGKAQGDFVSIDNTVGDIIFPFEEEITIDASAADEDVYYRILIDGSNNSDSDTFGLIAAGETLTITLASGEYDDVTDGNGLVIGVSGADVFAHQVVRNMDGTDNSTNIILANNPNYNTGGSIDSDVSIPDDYVAQDLVTFTINAGIALGGATTNATFGSFKSTQYFADLIAAVGTDADFAYPSVVSVRFDPNYAHINTVKTDDSTSDVAIQGISVTGDDGVDDIVSRGQFVGADGRVGLTVTADSAIDYGSFQAGVRAETEKVIANVDAEAATVVTAINNARDFITDNDDDNFDAANGG